MREVIAARSEKCLVDFLSWNQKRRNARPALLQPLKAQPERGTERS